MDDIQLENVDDIQLDNVDDIQLDNMDDIQIDNADNIFSELFVVFNQKILECNLMFTYQRISSWCII